MDRKITAEENIQENVKDWKERNRGEEKSHVNVDNNKSQKLEQKFKLKFDFIEAFCLNAKGTLNLGVDIIT